MKSLRALFSALLLGSAACADDAAEPSADASLDASGADASTADGGAADAAPTDGSLLDALVDASGATDAGAVGDAQTGDAAAPNCKRGIAYGQHSAADLSALSPGVHWWYNWSPKPESGAASVYRQRGVSFVPMAWGRFEAAKLRSELPEGSDTLLGFNEPNFRKQANLSASDAAARWQELEAIADERGLKLASPAVNFCGPAQDCHDTDPFNYLRTFFAACKGCRVDYIAAHWYACDGPALLYYLGELKKFGKPIWLTEFSCGDGQDRSLAKQKQYMREALPILEEEPMVARYAWFAGRTTEIPNVALLGADGKLTELGELYLSLPHHDPACAR